MKLSERIFPIVTRTPMGVYTMQGLSEDEFAYLVAVVGTGNSLAGEDGAIGGDPLTPAASGLYAKLREAASRDGLSETVDAIESAQERWQRQVYGQASVDSARTSGQVLRGAQPRRSAHLLLALASLGLWLLVWPMCTAVSPRKRYESS